MDPDFENKLDLLFERCHGDKYDCSMLFFVITTVLYFKQSKVQGYRSRSSFKLIEINNKFRFLNKSTYLLDLGSSPGGWSQVANEKIIHRNNSYLVD